MVQRFHAWEQSIKNRMASVHLSPMDEIQVLMANTSGKAKQVVETYHLAQNADLNQALANIWYELRRRYGTTHKIATAVLETMEKLPKIKMDAKLADNLDLLTDACVVAESQMSNVKDLQVLDFACTQKLVIAKLPDSYHCLLYTSPSPRDRG